MLISYRDTTDTLRNISQGQMHRCSGMHLLLGKQILYFLLYDHQVNVGQQVINSSNIFLFHLGTIETVPSVITRLLRALLQHKKLPRK